jgi:hypothetical protein
MEGLDVLNLNLLGHSGRSFILVGCCIIPCVQGLIQQLIETALPKQSPTPYPNNLFLLETQKHESQ